MSLNTYQGRELTRVANENRLPRLVLPPLSGLSLGWLVSASSAFAADAEGTLLPGVVHVESTQLGITLLVTLLLLLATILVLLRRERAFRQLRRTVANEKSDATQLLNGLPGLVWLKSPDGRYLNANASVAQRFGLPLEDIIGATDFELMDAEQARRARRLDRAAINHGRLQGSANWVTFLGDRRSIYLHTLRRPLYDDKGRLIGVLCAGRDITDLYKAEQTLKQRDSYQRALLDNFPFSVWLKDTDGHVLAANQAFADNVGVDSPALLAMQTDNDIWPSEIAKQEIAEDRKVMRRGMQTEHLKPVQRGGETRWYETYKAPVVDNDGQLLGTVGFARDTTERHRIEEALRVSEARFRRLFENHSAIMLMIVPESGVIENANHAAVKFYGYPMDELKGKSIDEINILPAEQVAEQRRRVLTGEQTHFEFQHRLASGEVRDVEVHSSTVESDGNNLLLSIIHDITERREADRQQQLAASVFKQAHEAIVITETDGRIVDVNPAFTEITGYSRSDAIGNKISMLSSGKHDAAFYRDLWSALNEQGFWHGEICNRTKTGRFYVERLHISAVHDRDGKVAHYVGQFIETKAAEQAETALPDESS